MARFSFTVEPDTTANVVRRAHGSFASALAYAGDPVVTKAPPGRVFDRTWSAWVDVRGIGFDRNTSGGDLNGKQLNVTAGLARKRLKTASSRRIIPVHPELGRSEM